MDETSQPDPAPNKPYDLVCVGFGPASLAIAVALHDRGVKARTLFLERQQSFAWHAGMLIPGARMQISFLKDLATLRNPRSKFTFLNYLKSQNRLVSFTNLSTFLPWREEFNDYLAWCASHFRHCVHYGREAVSVSPVEDDGASGVIKLWHVRSRDVVTMEETTVTAKHVIIATGGEAKVPPAFPSALLNEKVVHSSRYADVVPQLLSTTNEIYNIAVVGGGQSAAEIFDNLHSSYPRSKVTLFTAGSALRPSDDSPFVNEIFEPERVDDFYSLSGDLRKKAILEDSATNYGVVREELLHRLYEKLYYQRLAEPDESRWRNRIVTLREVVGVERQSGSSGSVRMRLRNVRTGELEMTTACFDLVIVATGYVRNAHETLLEPVRYLLQSDTYTVGRDYRIKFKEEAVGDDCGIWLQGCCEESHGLNDSLLSILAVRSGEIVDSIFTMKLPNRLKYAKL